MLSRYFFKSLSGGPCVIHSYGKTVIAQTRNMSFEGIVEAKKRISGFLHETPVLTNSTFDKIVGRKCYFKCENFQKTGSFKARGALNAVLKLKEKQPKVPGVVTHSSGNHGQALAWAAKTAGLSCAVVVPDNTPSVKCEAIKGYGAELVFCKPNPQSRAETCSWVSMEKNYTIIPPFDHEDVIAGQGTLGMEFLSQTPDLDAILVPISGGGMTSGIAIAAKNLNPSTRVFAVEPKGKQLEQSLKAGKRLWEDPPRFVDTIADGIRFQQCGHLTFPLLCQYAEKEVFTVTDDEMIEAMKFIWQRAKLVIEVSSGAGVAAAMSERMKKMDPAIEKVGIILCGGNVDLDKLPWY